MSGLQFVHKVAVIYDVRPLSFIAEQLIHERAILTRDATADAREFLHPELDVFELQRLHARMGRDRMDALLSPGAEQI